MYTSWALLTIKKLLSLVIE